MQTNVDATAPTTMSLRPDGFVLFTPGELLEDKYEVRRAIGQGGMGQVFEAHDHVLNRRVAIKAAWPHIERTCLHKEAQALAAVRHPSMVTVHGMGAHRGVDYVVMERIYGVGLDTHLERRRQNAEPFTIGETIDVLLALAQGLAAVHRAGLAHRDVKPANIMLTPGKRVVLMDFGISVPESDESSSGSSLSGTVQYMAPESLSGGFERGHGYLVDVYALGVIAFEMLTGRVPYEGNVLEICRQHLGADVPDVSAIRKDTPAPLAAVVRDLMAKAPNDRPQSMELVEWRLRALRSVDEAPPSTDEPFSVLIVDDDPVVTEVLRLVAKKAVPGAEVRAVSDGEHAIESVRRKPPSVILLDLHMPGMNGIEVCMVLRGTHVADRCTVVSVSASAGEHDLQLLQQLGITRFVHKGPDLRAELLPILHELRRLW